MLIRMTVIVIRLLRSLMIVTIMIIITKHLTIGVINMIRLLVIAGVMIVKMTIMVMILYVQQ